MYEEEVIVNRTSIPNSVQSFACAYQDIVTKRGLNDLQRVIQTLNTNFTSTIDNAQKSVTYNARNELKLQQFEIMLKNSLPSLLERWIRTYNKTERKMQLPSLKNASIEEVMLKYATTQELCNELEVSSLEVQHIDHSDFQGHPPSSDDEDCYFAIHIFIHSSEMRYNTNSSNNNNNNNNINNNGDNAIDDYNRDIVSNEDRDEDDLTSLYISNIDTLKEEMKNGKVEIWHPLCFQINNSTMETILRYNLLQLPPLPLNIEPMLKYKRHELSLRSPTTNGTVILRFGAAPHLMYPLLDHTSSLDSLIIKYKLNHHHHHIHHDINNNMYSLNIHHGDDNHNINDYNNNNEEEEEDGDIRIESNALLCDMPQEILEKIYMDLPMNALFSLSMTCKKLNISLNSLSFWRQRLSSSISFILNQIPPSSSALSLQSSPSSSIPLSLFQFTSPPSLLIHSLITNINRYKNSINDNNDNDINNLSINDDDDDDIQNSFIDNEMKNSKLVRYRGFRKEVKELILSVRFVKCELKHELRLRKRITESNIIADFRRNFYTYHVLHSELNVSECHFRSRLQSIQPLFDLILPVQYEDNNNDDYQSYVESSDINNEMNRGNIEELNNCNNEVKGNIFEIGCYLLKNQIIPFHSLLLKLIEFMKVLPWYMHDWTEVLSLINRSKHEYHLYFQLFPIFLSHYDKYCKNQYINNLGSICFMNIDVSQHFHSPLMRIRRCLKQLTNICAILKSLRDDGDETMSKYLGISHLDTLFNSTTYFSAISNQSNISDHHHHHLLSSLSILSVQIQNLNNENSITEMDRYYCSSCPILAMHRSIPRLRVALVDDHCAPYILFSLQFVSCLLFEKILFITTSNSSDSSMTDRIVLALPLSYYLSQSVADHHDYHHILRFSSSELPFFAFQLFHDTPQYHRLLQSSTFGLVFDNSEVEVFRSITSQVSSLPRTVGYSSSSSSPSAHHFHSSLVFPRVLRDTSTPNYERKWDSEVNASFCSSCVVRFTFMERRHHCRCCGQIFCNSCTKHKSSLPHLRYKKKQRVCECCFLSLSYSKFPNDDDS